MRLIPNAQSFHADKQLAAQRYPSEDSDGMLGPRGRGEKITSSPLCKDERRAGEATAASLSATQPAAVSVSE